jgi:hypothetical protein
MEGRARPGIRGSDIGNIDPLGLSNTRENEGGGMIGGGRDSRRNPRPLGERYGGYVSYGFDDTGLVEPYPCSVPRTICGALGYGMLYRRLLFSVMFMGASRDWYGEVGVPVGS